MKIQFEDLSPGLKFCFRAPRRLLFFQRWGLARIVALDPSFQTVHVEIVESNETDGHLRTTIGHLPLAFSALRDSITLIGSRQELESPFVPSLQDWRSRATAGEVGAFSKSIYDAIVQTWRTVNEVEPEATSESIYIEYSFPKVGKNGRMNTIQVVWHTDNPAA